MSSLVTGYFLKVNFRFSGKKVCLLANEQTRGSPTLISRAFQCFSFQTGIGIRRSRTIDPRLTAVYPIDCVGLLIGEENTQQSSRRTVRNALNKTVTWYSERSS